MQQETFRLLEKPYVEASVILQLEPRYDLLPFLGLEYSALAAEVTSVAHERSP